MDMLTQEEIAAVRKALLSDTFKYMIGAEEWELTEEEETLLWSAIKKLSE